MRLLKRSQSGDGFQLETFDDDHPPEYAILSHTWADEEVTYNDVVGGTGTSKAGYGKVEFCGRQAERDHLEYFWIDSCCIDQSNMQELSTAINSMFRWYQRASKCCVYLLDVEVLEEVEPETCPEVWLEAFRKSRWFTRGWTLQELLAPTSVEFYCKQGTLLGSRVSLEQEISQITGIATSALRGQDLAEFSIEDRMSWTTGRATTKREDKIYCLLGIFKVVLPLIYGEGEEYAMTRLKEEIQRRHEGCGTDGLESLPVFSTLTFPRNEAFVGRVHELKTLDRSLLHPKTHSRMAMYGLGGCGKSALAIEFAYRTLSKYARLILWVPAITRQTFEVAYRDIGARLKIPGVTDRNADVKKLVRDALSSDDSGRWLMIVDNADDHDVLLASVTDSTGTPSRLSDYLPRSDKGAILFTTRSRKMAHTLTPGTVLPLNTLDTAGTKELLSRRLTNQPSHDDDESIKELLGLLTHLPLAIVQAAAFMNNNDVTVSAYVKMLQEADVETELLSECFVDESRYEGLDSTVAKTWHISFDQILKNDPPAAEVLSFIACIDHVNIPQSLLAGTMSLVQQTKALGTLTGYAFLTERQQTSETPENERFFDVHRLVHLASQWWLDRCKQSEVWADTALHRLMDLVPYGGVKTRKVWTSYLPHAICVAGYPTLRATTVSADLLFRVASCQQDLGQYSTAEDLYRRCMSIAVNVHGLKHPETLVAMHNIGVALLSQGRYATAESLLRETLDLSKAVLGEEDLSTLYTTRNLALVIIEQGRLDEAEDLIRDNLRLHKKLLGERHPDTLYSMSSLGTLLYWQGKYAEAESLHRELLEMSKAVLGEDDHQIFVSMNNLAHALEGQGMFNQAESLFYEVLKISKRVLGNQHPGTLTIMNNLALCLGRQMRYDEAEELLRETLTASQKVLGDQHPHTLRSIFSLGINLWSQYRYDGALSLLERAYAGCRVTLGENHPETRNALQACRDIAALQERNRVVAAGEERSEDNEEILGKGVSVDSVNEHISMDDHLEEESLSCPPSREEDMGEQRLSERCVDEGEPLEDHGTDKDRVKRRKLRHPGSTLDE